MQFRPYSIWTADKVTQRHQKQSESLIDSASDYCTSIRVNIQAAALPRMSNYALQHSKSLVI